jgi:hypothetical protein
LNNFRNIFIVENRNHWFTTIEKDFNPKIDLVLTYDFGVKKDVENLGGKSLYLDHLGDTETNDQNNHLIYKFFHKWHYDKDGKDLFIYKNIPFGTAFRVEIWNDFLTFLALRLNLEKLIRDFRFEKIFVSASNKNIGQVLLDLKVDFIKIEGEVLKKSPSYFFPIAKYMDDRLRAKGLRGFLYWAREKVTTIWGYSMIFIDKLLLTDKKRKAVFIQEYNPTKKIIANLKKDSRFKVVLLNFSRGTKILDHFSERLIPVYGFVKNYREISKALLDNFQKNRFEKLILQNGEDISERVYEIILERVSERLPHHLRILNSSINYIDHNRLDLLVLIANIGVNATLLHSVAKARKIETFLIINGFLGKQHQEESKDADFINSYSESIKENYFKNSEKVYVLGDSRMDSYADLEKRVINRENPTITIGTSAFNLTDLNSYMAVEFEFMFDILLALKTLKERGEVFKIIIKTRPNGYKEQYQKFIKEYFPDLEIEILSTTPMIEVLKITDLYLTIYSQTLFEASSLGIPVIYYKKDVEIIDSPFNGNSELVTLFLSEEIIQAFYDFKKYDDRFKPFLKKEVMEKYIGFLDGKNLERNTNFIKNLLENKIL